MANHFQEVVLKNLHRWSSIPCLKQILLQVGELHQVSDTVYHTFFLVHIGNQFPNQGKAKIGIVGNWKLRANQCWGKKVMWTKALCQQLYYAVLTTLSRSQACYGKIEMHIDFRNSEHFAQRSNFFMNFGLGLFYKGKLQNKGLFNSQVCVKSWFEGKF